MDAREWPKVCTSYRHAYDAIPAVGRYVGPCGEYVWYCKSCAILHGSLRTRQGYKWEPLREQSPAPPTSERVQP